MHYNVLQCGMTKDFFCRFLMKISANVIAKYGSTPDIYKIFDNAPSYRNLHGISLRKSFHENLPKYSPMFEPIARAFSTHRESQTEVCFPPSRVYLLTQKPTDDAMKL